MRPLTRADLERGATLIEVMVAGGVFLLLMISTTFFYDLSQRSNRRVSVHSEAYREGALVLRHIRQELKGASVDLEMGDDPREWVAYRIPQWKDGHIVVDHRGLPVWEAERKLQVELSGALVRLQDGESRQLARLGDGTVWFERAAPTLLDVSVEVQRSARTQHDGPGSHRRLKMTVGLSEQQFWNDITILKKE